MPRRTGKLVIVVNQNAIVKHRDSRGALQLNMGTLYPGLMRLEQRGLVKGEWGVTDNNRKARFYAITAAGRRQLADEKAEWQRMTTIMHTLLHGEE